MATEWTTPKTWAVNDILTAADMNTYVRDNAKALLGVCTSTSHPSSPTEGQKIYETDTDKNLVYDGASFTRFKNLPWGYLASAKATTAQTGITTLADLTGLSATFTVSTGRRYEIVGRVPVKSTSGSPGAQRLVLATSGGTQLEVSYSLFTIGSNDYTEEITAEVTSTQLGTGSRTVKLRFGRAGGDGATYATTVNGTQPGKILVKDIGPSSP